MSDLWGDAKMKRFWLSWIQPGYDYRPMSFPPGKGILGWWLTGKDSQDRAILCALVEAKDEQDAWHQVWLDWPDMGDRRFATEQDKDYQVISDRFPLKDWIKERMVRDDQSHDTRA